MGTRQMRLSSDRIWEETYSLVLTWAGKSENQFEHCVSFAGLLFASGLAATATLTSILKQGDHVVAMDDLYGGRANLIIHLIVLLFGCLVFRSSKVVRIVF